VSAWFVFSGAEMSEGRPDRGVQENERHGRSGLGAAGYPQLEGQSREELVSR